MSPTIGVPWPPRMIPSPMSPAIPATSPTEIALLCWESSDAGALTPFPSRIEAGSGSEARETA